MDLVLYDAMLASARLHLLQKCVRLCQARRQRLLAIDVLAGANCLFDRMDALPGRCRIEEDRVLAARQRGIEIGAPIRNRVRAGNRANAIGVAADQQEVREPALIPDRQTAFPDDRDESIGEMLRRGYAAGGAIDDDTDCLLRHGINFGP